MELADEFIAAGRQRADAHQAFGFSKDDLLDLEGNAVELPGVASSLLTTIDTRLFAGTRISSGSNLWFRIVRLNSCAPAGAHRIANAATIVATTSPRIRCSTHKISMHMKASNAAAQVYCGIIE
jgi:hypothetical protein